MRHFSARFALLLAFVFAACYQSPVPPAASPLPIDTTLLGQWEEIDAEGSPAIVAISRRENRYLIEMPWSLPGGGQDTLHALATITPAGTAQFMSLREIDGDDPKYLVLKLTRHADGTMAIATLRSSVPQFTSSAAFQAYLEDHGNDPGIIEDEARFRKVSVR